MATSAYVFPDAAPTASVISGGGICNVSSCLTEDDRCCDNFTLDYTDSSPTNGTLLTNPYIQPWPVQLVYIVFFVSMVTIAAGGNIIVIWIVLAHKRMRTVTNYFLVNLAVADALISIMNTLFNFVYMLYSHWPFGKNYCKFSMFIAPCTISASVFTFMAIAIDRYMAIVHPLNPRMSAGTVLGVIAVIWLASVAVSFPAFIYADTYTWTLDEGAFRTICYMNWEQKNDFGYNIFVMLVNYFVPLTILTVTYMRVGIELWGSQTIGEYTPRQDQNIKSKRKVVKTMIVVVVIFGVCWLPQHIYFIATNVHEELGDIKFIQHVYLSIYWLAMSNSMYNPIIYCWMNARFREGFKHVFRWCPWVKLKKKGAVRGVGTTGRVSVSEAPTTFDRNGSMMHTVIETLEETSYCPSGTAHRSGYTPAHKECENSL